MSAIYLHIPFCKRLCGYCDFFKSVKLQQLDAVLDAMEQELVEEREFLGDKSIHSIYFGGGTPSLVSAERIGRFMELISRNFDVEQLKEVTLEANPDDITKPYLEALRAVGVNRLSIGIQSFDDDELRMMNRRHSAAQAVEAVQIAQSVGFDNITIDLIFGVAGYGSDTLSRSIATALWLGVQHISAYHLTVESGTPFARQVSKGTLEVVDDSVSQSEYELLERELTACGFHHYEVSNYALPGYRSQHNSSYWRGVHYLGIGAAAHSFNGRERRYAVSSIEGYLAGGSERYECEVLSEVDRYNELVMTSLRCCEGIDLELLRRDFSPRFLSHALRAAAPWLDQGKLCEQGSRLYIPTKYFLISDSIIESLFFDAL